MFKYLLIKFFQKSVSASNKFHFPKILQNIFYSCHYNYMEYLLKPYFNKARQYIVNSDDFKGDKNSSIIWMFWWQGFSNMPLIVKRCIQSIKKYSNGHKVILLKRTNIKHFAKLPNIIYKKVDNGKIDLTHFSDILRFNILDQYGGLWVDATMYCTAPLKDKYFDYLYTAGGYNNTIPRFVKGRWTEFLIGGNSSNNMLKFVDKFLQIYFSNNNILINYFLADYALNYSYNNNLGNYKYYVNKRAKGYNPNLFVLGKLLNTPYNINVFKRITKDTNMFKLTYKEKFKNDSTFYHKIISNK